MRDIDVDIRPMGDAAVLVRLGDSIDPATVRRVWSLTRALDRAIPPGVLDVVPAYASVLMRFDPIAMDLAQAMAVARGAAERAESDDPVGARSFRVRACFEQACGMDFASTAHELGMRERRFRDLLCKPEYRVAFVGFLAGFPYLLGLPPALAVPRLTMPRPRVPAGSVAIAAGQCGIYPRESPGGWRLVGRTLAPLFDPKRQSPALFAPGDIVRFEPADTLDRTGTVEVAR